MRTEQLALSTSEREPVILSGIAYWTDRLWWPCHFAWPARGRAGL